MKYRVWAEKVDGGLVLLGDTYCWNEACRLHDVADESGLYSKVWIK